MPPPFWNPKTADALSAADTLSEICNDSTGPSGSTRVHQSVHSGQASLSSTFTTGFSGTDSLTDSPDTLCNLFTTPIDQGVGDAPEEMCDDAWDELHPGETGFGIVTTTGHNYVIDCGEDLGDSAMDS